MRKMEVEEWQFKFVDEWSTVEPFIVDKPLYRGHQWNPFIGDTSGTLYSG